MIEDDSILLLGPKDENLYASWSSKWPLQIPWSLLNIRGVLPESLGDQLGKVGKRIHGTRCDPKLRGQLPGVYLRTQSHHRLKWVAKKTWDPKNFVAILQNLPIIWFSSVVYRKNGKHVVLFCYILLLPLGRQYKTSVETLLWLITFWNHQFHWPWSSVVCRTWSLTLTKTSNDQFGLSRFSVTRRAVKIAQKVWSCWVSKKG